MKKLILFSMFTLLFSLSEIFARETLFNHEKASEEDSHFMTALTSGYVFKNDDALFKEVYGHGMVNILTADFCYQGWKYWGIGTKLGYWRAKGFSTLYGISTLLQEVPLTFYLRRKKDLDCGLQLYASLGGGVIWSKEKSEYIGTLNLAKGIGEIETGLHYNLYKCVNITGAFRYLFPAQKNNSGVKITVGGIDLRAGLSFDF